MSPIPIAGPARRITPTIRTCSATYGPDAKKGFMVVANRIRKPSKSSARDRLAAARHAFVPIGTPVIRLVGAGGHRLGTFFGQALAHFLEPHVGNSFELFVERMMRRFVWIVVLR